MTGMSNNELTSVFTDVLTLNILEFSHAQKRLTAYIGPEETPDGVRLSAADSAGLLGIFDGEDVLYAGFDGSVAGTKAVDRAVMPVHAASGEQPWSLSFLKKYYTYRLTQHFRAKGIPATNNFVSDTQVWIRAQSPYPGCTGYRVFTLRVQFSGPKRQPELLVVSGEISSVYGKPVTDPVFSEISEELFNRVMFRGGLYRYSEMPDLASRHLEEVYPCVSFDLLRALHIARPAPDKTNRYLKYSSEIAEFRNTYLTDKALQDIMQLAPDWKQVQPQRLDMKGMRLLQFGEGTHAEPKYGVKQHGPKELLAHETVFFFIMHTDDMPLAFALNEYLAGEHSDFPGGVNGFLRMKYNTESKLSIAFADKENPLKEIEQKLSERRFTAGRRYVAIYLSPYGKWTLNAHHKTFYYRIKELLLQRGIVSQTVEVDKLWERDRPVVQVGSHNRAVVKKNFHFSLPNILVAIHAKSGGTPWCLQTPFDDELVIGISAYRSRDLDRNYLGSAFSFTAGGHFQGFECFKSGQLNELAGSIALAVRNYCSGRKNLRRLVIHFYKRLSWRELRPIEKVLSELGLSVPVVVVSVNKTFSEDMVGFDHKRLHKMPMSGVFLPLERNQYLLFNNQLQQGDEKLNDREGYPFPLKITIQQFHPGSNRYVESAASDAEALLTQVCRFSQLYWKSVSRQWVPVTLRYPEMLAQIVPHFRYMDMPELGRENLWFL